MKNDCATVILNWNGSRDTISCIESMCELDGRKSDLIIVDNDSTSDNFENLENYFSDFILSEELSGLTAENGVVFTSIKKYLKDDIVIYLTRAATNYGFSKGCNAGAFISSLLGYEYVLFLNNDTEVESNFLTLLINDLELDSKLLAVIPQIRYFYDKNIIWNCGGVISNYGNRKYYFSNAHYKDINDVPSLRNINFATGCCILFRTKEFIEVGMFTEKFFFGEEDIELSLRLIKMNKKLACNMRSLIYHKVGASITGDHAKILRKAYIHYLNRLVNMKSFLGFKWWLWMIPSMFKIMINIIRINKVSFLEFITFISSIFVDSIRRQDVDKEKFEKVLKNGF